MSKVYISLLPAPKGYQLSINKMDDDGRGHGFRIFGPKYVGDLTPIVRKALTKRDADEIRSYLDFVS